MKSYIVFDMARNFEGGGFSWDDPTYRWVMLGGSTYSETELRTWAARVWKGEVKPTSTIEEIANVIAKGGWSLLEKIS
jgi:hypothetical protein